MTTATFRHDALLYRNEDEFVTTILPFLREGIAAGEGIVAAMTERNIRVISGALGPEAAAVQFVPSTEVYRSPHAAIAAYHAVIEECGRRGHPSVRAVGEVIYGSSQAEQDMWLRYEPTAHEVFQGTALHVVCPYDLRELPPRIVDHARRTHPHLRHEDHAINPMFVDPSTMLSRLPEPFSFDAGRAPELVVEAGAVDLVPARRALWNALARDLSPVRAEEALAAVGEILANGVRHGAGAVTASVWSNPALVVCSVANVGAPIADPFAGYRPPRERHQGGMGLWIARQLSDEMVIRAGEHGPVVTLAFRRDAPPRTAPHQATSAGRGSAAGRRSRAR